MMPRSILCYLCVHQFTFIDRNIFSCISETCFIYLSKLSLLFSKLVVIFITTCIQFNIIASDIESGCDMIIMHSTFRLE